MYSLEFFYVSEKLQYYLMWYNDTFLMRFTARNNYTTTTTTTTTTTNNNNNNNNNWRFSIAPCGMPCIMKALYMELLIISVVEEMSFEQCFEFIKNVFISNGVG